MAIIGKKFGESKSYIAVDMKSFYASVECVARGMNSLTTNLLVADNTRTDKTICLAVSPSLKAIGVPGRPTKIYVPSAYFTACGKYNYKSLQHGFCMVLDCTCRSDHNDNRSAGMECGNHIRNIGDYLISTDDMLSMDDACI